jgi:hypothetical protein
MQDIEVIVLVDEMNAREVHAIHQVFGRILGWRIAITPERETARTSSLPVIDRSQLPLGIGWHSPRADEQEAVLRPDRTAAMLRSAFHGAEGDKHGRVRSQALLVSRCGWSDRPIVDEVVLAMAERMRASLPQLPPARRTFRQVITLDVDNGFKFLGRPWWITAGALLRDVLKGHGSEVRDRIAVLAGRRSDPYDIDREFVTLAAEHGDRTIVNYLVAPRGPHDHAVGVRSRKMVERMREMATRAEIGIHPSYASSERPGTIAAERSALERAIGAPVWLSRQHFLRFRHPDTFLELAHCGITEDHSLGFHDAIGFRAGTCTPFPFFDEAAQQGTDLMIHPFQVMDSALCYKMRLSPAEAIAASQRIVDRVKAVNGTFVGVWHERFLSDHGSEAGWRNVIDSIIRYARP